MGCALVQPPLLRLSFSFTPSAPEPIPHPQIQVHSSSSTMGRCNVSLECASPGTTGDLTVTWLSKDFPEEPGQRGVLESATSSRHLSLSLPWDQLDGHLTCVVSNPVDRKNVTLHLESVCLRRGESSPGEGAGLAQSRGLGRRGTEGRFQAVSVLQAEMKRHQQVAPSSLESSNLQVQKLDQCTDSAASPAP